MNKGGWLVAVVLVIVGGARGAEEPPRFTAGLVDGTKLEGREVLGWHDTKSQPNLGGKPLFEEKKEARWLIDHLLPPSGILEEYVEFAGGDRLPCRIVGAKSGLEYPYYLQPPHLVVDPLASVDWPDGQPPRQIRVLSQAVRRVVWQRRGQEELKPGTLYYRDGRQLEFRSLRWTNGGVRVLTAQGTEEAHWGQLAELHAPASDGWDAHFEQLAALTPGGQGRWMQWETTDGLRLTGSTERFQAKTRGGGDPNRWFHLIQPAWALDPLWVSHRTIRVRRYFKPEELPLSVLLPEKQVEKRMLATGWPWQANRSVQGSRLKAGGQEYAWGLGVHAYTELHFQLPPWVRAFRGKAGLDQTAGTGGCAKVKVYLDQTTGQPWFESKVLIGSEETVDLGRLEFPTSEKTRQLILVADPLLGQRPPGADPFDIRDTVDWLEPMLELDPALVRQEITRRSQRLIPAWRDWAVEETSGGAASLVNHWDEIDSRDPRYLLQTAPRERFLTISRDLDIGNRQNWLILAVSRFNQGTSPSKIQVRLDGQVYETFEVPVRQSKADPNPLIIPLFDYRGLTLNVQITQLPTGENAMVDWRAVAVVDQLPGLLRVFEDDQAFLDLLTEGAGQAKLSGDRFSGRSAMQITPVDKANANLPNFNLAIRDAPKLGEYRYIRFAWKHVGDGGPYLEMAHEGQWGKAGKRNSPTYRYACSSTKAGPDATSIERKSPSDWTVVTRDLYGDFGTFDLTGFSFNCYEGEHTLFDHIYLGRTREDFDRIDASIEALNARIAQEEFLGRVGEAATRLRAGITHAYQAEHAFKIRDYYTSREHANKALSLLPTDTSTYRRIKKLMAELPKE